VDVSFKTTRLRRCYEDAKARTKEWGTKVAQLYVQRVDLLHAVEDAQRLRGFRSIDFHALAGDRKGQYALRLDGFYRLIVTFSDRRMTVVQVEEVSKHYGD
jgi:proteic killer suppression protein